MFSSSSSATTTNSYRNGGGGGGSSTMIRHSGRALIRGKIRRVWRPRYLELCDSGLVRYYELENSTTTTVGATTSTEDWYHVGMIPKCVLVVFHARIIDVTTLRDMHVGLPMGSFGFVFHGQRFVYYTNETNCHPPEHVTPRDFLCAVSTLEEAQSWVVALQWASSRHDVDWQDDNYRAFLPKGVFETIPQQPSSTRTTSSSSSSSSSLRKQKSSKQGKTVVTKVRSLQLVRVDGWHHWQVAYLIKILLLKSSTTTTTGRQATMEVEERTILRTLHDIEVMRRDLEKEVTTNRRARQVLQQSQLPTTTVKGYAEYVASVPQVDQMLRTLAMDATLCNSQSMRSFWSLASTAQKSSSSSCSSGLLWPLHNPRGLVECTPLPSPHNTKDFVQHWLQQEDTYNKSQTKRGISFYGMSILVWLMERPSSVIGGLASVVVLIPTLPFVYQRCLVSIVSIRLDFLLLTWAISAYLGREYERRSAALSDSASSTSAVPVKQALDSSTDSLVNVTIVDGDALMDDIHSVTSEEDAELDDEPDELIVTEGGILSSPLPEYPSNGGASCWSKPETTDIFHVRGATYLQDRVKVPSGPPPFACRGVDIWLTDNPERHIARHPSVLGGKLGDEDTFVVNFLLPFGNFVAYFGIPSLEQFPQKVANVWTKFLQGDQQYRDARLKLLPVVMDGPWIVKAAVGPGTSPALLGKVIPLQYYFPSSAAAGATLKGCYEVDVIITASRIAKGIFNVVKGHTKTLTMAFAFIIEAAEEEELPETVLCTFQIHSISLEDCPRLPECNLDEIKIAN